MVTAAAAAATLGPEPETETLVDMSKLTQSELQSLSLRCCSSSSSLDRHLTSSDHLFLPKIDRSLFNESAGSRRQTFSRPDSAFSSSSSSAAAAAGHHHRNRVAGLLPAHKLPSLALDDDPERRENVAIIRTLQHYISLNPSPSFTHFDLIPPSLPAPVGVFSESLMSFEGERKRKRGRKPKGKMDLNVDHRVENEEMGTLEMKNRNGVTVDVDALAGLEDPYGEEFTKRTEGMQSEEELLAFLRDLGGEWGSRRKRRKIVDAGIFGDFLPIGWKLILGLRRREGRASVFCRRYVSPSGQQFISCKEISSYFRSHLGLQAAPQLMIQGGNNIQQDCRLDIVHQHTGQTAHSIKNESQSPDIVSRSTHSSQNALNKEANSPHAENVAVVQADGLFECHKCNTTFSEKDTYLQHLVSFHQRTMRRYRIGSSVGDGVIMKDGKYECQFCHKVFDERRRYNGHVGIHVRNYVRSKEESSGQGSILNKMESSSGNGLPCRISKMDALIEIAQSSILQTSAAGGHHNLNGISPDCRAKESTACFASKANPDNDLKVGSSTSAMERTDSEQTIDEELTDMEDECASLDVKGKLKADPDHASDVNMDLECEKRVIESMDGQNNNTIKMCSGEDCQTVTLSDVPKTEAVDRKGSESSLDLLNGDLGSTGPIEDPNNNDKIKEIVNGNTGHAQLDTDLGSTDPTGNPNISDSGSAGPTVDPNDNEKIKEIVDGNIGHAELGTDLGSTGPTANPNNDEKMLEIVDGNTGHAEVVIDVKQTIQQNPDSNIQQSGIPDTISKGEDDFCNIEQREENLAPFEELRYDEIEPLEFQFIGMEEDSHPIPEVPSDMTPIPFGSEELALDLMTSGHQQTSSCVWCGVEFSHEATESDVQSDSVGFMCPTCKVKISGELNAFGNSSPADTNRL